jgi:hypothetical protein
VRTVDQDIAAYAERIAAAFPPPSDEHVDLVARLLFRRECDARGSGEAA